MITTKTALVQRVQRIRAFLSNESNAVSNKIKEKATLLGWLHFSFTLGSLKVRLNENVFNVLEMA